MHRFNTVDRELTEKIDLVDDAETDKNKMKKTIEGIRCEGYIYKPHHKIKIRSFSDILKLVTIQQVVCQSTNTKYHQTLTYGEIF
jgi:hypothetical protein